MNNEIHVAAIRRLMRAGLNNYRSKFRDLPGSEEAVRYMRKVIRDDVAKKRRANPAA